MRSHGHFVLEAGKSEVGEPEGPVQGLIKLFCAHVWVAVLSGINVCCWLWFCKR